MSKPTELRRRSLPGPLLKGRKVQTFLSTGASTVVASDARECFGKQVTVSEGHRWPPPKGGDLNDYGGDFYTSKTYIKSPSSAWSSIYYVLNGFLGIRNSGHFLPTDPFVAMNNSSSAESSNSALDVLGATAISRCAPGNPVASVTTAAGELLKDGLPNLPGLRSWQKRADLLVKSGDEFLNLAFGWAPLISDIKSISNGVVNFDSLVAQYERDAGKVVRRRYNFPLQKSSEISTLSTTARPWLVVNLDSGFNGPYGTLVRNREISKSQTFSGAFTYYLPSGYDSRLAVADAASRARVILGVDLTPDTLWELAPWSWAVDWFSNAGDVVHNVSRFSTGGLIMRYGYMMEHSIMKDTYTLYPSGLSSIYKVQIPSLVVITETKKRRKANPFGFGLTWNGLSPFQASILGALGITRVAK